MERNFPDCPKNLSNLAPAGHLWIVQFLLTLGSATGCLYVVPLMEHNIPPVCDDTFR
jgi:hypothetical protein